MQIGAHRNIDHRGPAEMVMLRKTGKRCLVIWILLLFSIVSAVPVVCGEPPKKEFDSIEALIELLMMKGVINEKEAGQFIERYRLRQSANETQKAVTIVPEEKETEYIQKITEKVTREINKDINRVEGDLDFAYDDLQREDRLQTREIERVGEKVDGEMAEKLYKSEWAQRIRFGGDIRLRYQEDRFAEDNLALVNPKDPSEIMNTTIDRNRLRYRIRVSMKAKIADPREINVGKVEAGVRIATGKDDNPISTNNTLGEYFLRDSIALDRGYLKWTYQPELPVWERFPEVTVIGGRFKNPWFFTDLVWDSDLNFEGLAFSLVTDTLQNSKPKGFLTMGAFPLDEENGSDRQKWLYGLQAGIDHQLRMDLAYKLGIAYYDYRNIGGVKNFLNDDFWNFTAPEYQTKGNTLVPINPPKNEVFGLKYDYNLLNLTGQFDYTKFFPLHIILTGDYVKNIGVEGPKAFVTDYGPVEESEGYQFGFKVGFPKVMNAGEWNTSLFYKHLEANAVIDAFTDSDFHLGGTNAKGWVLKGEYCFFKNVWFSAKWISSDSVESELFNDSLPDRNQPYSIDTLQIDLNARY